MDAIFLDLFTPIFIGNVTEYSFLSPSISSMSFTISRENVVKDNGIQHSNSKTVVIDIL